MDRRSASKQEEAQEADEAPDQREESARSSWHERSRWGWPRIVRYAALIAVAASGVIGFFGVGRWLVIEDPLQQAHAIVVLSGAMPIRALEAARIYRQGFASRVWVTHSQSPAETLRQMGISYVGEEFYSRKVLMSQGVPEDAIRVFELQTSNTESELTEVARLLQQEDGGTVIVVTTKPHTRRVRAIWKRVAGPERRLIVRYPADDPYDGAHWWRHTRDALDVVREVLGLLNAWAGFPVHAQSR